MKNCVKLEETTDVQKEAREADEVDRIEMRSVSEVLGAIRLLETRAFLLFPGVNRAWTPDTYK